ncbi:hypothetical protein EHS25_008146 [Saitozyma podzolica]|uniref:Mid2 domain-containing protein n=1 Tax=Saitozyma podzolica TaxID=1890683 RepID=A0A427YNR6_9TREE|nr:hypothetical protein EHS25_008146 [Saitozyma podzolica]
MWPTYLVVFSTILALGCAQKITTTNDAGQTIFEIVTTDANDVLTTTTLSTATSAVTTTTLSTATSATRIVITNTKIVGPLGRPPASTSTPSTTTGFTASPTITAVTISIPAGTIINYGDYQTSVFNDAAAQSGSATNALFATATGVGSAAQSRVPLLPVSAVLVSVVGSLALAWVMSMMA